MRESSGRTDRWKRPDSPCSSSTTSAWKRRPFLSTSTMSPGPIPFELRREAAVAGGAGRRLVWLMRGDASAARGRRARAASPRDARGDLGPHAAVQREVLGAAGAHVQEGPGSLAEGGKLGHRLVGQAEEGGDALRVEAGGGGDVLLVGV